MAAMTIRSLAAVLALLSFAAAAPALAKPPAQAAGKPAAKKPAVVPEGWKHVVSDKGNYSLVFPGEPAAQDLTDDAGKYLATMFVLELDNGNVAYMSSFSDLPLERTTAGPDQILSDARDGALKSSKGTLVSEKKITLDGFPGRELQISTPNGMTSFVRVYLVKSRLYQSMGVMPKDKIDGKQVRTFLESFRLK